LPQSVHIERIDYSDPAIRLGLGALGRIGPIRPIARWLSSWRDLPDRHRRFAELAVTRAHELMREGLFDVILTSSPPPSVHLAGLALHGDIPWIADFRDPWQALSDDYGPTLFHRLRNSGLHKRILTFAGAIVAVTPELQSYFVHGCGGPSVTVIRNGYDEADFSGRDSKSDSSSEFRIVIPGTFSRFSDPRPLLRALSLWRTRNPDTAVRIVHLGASLGFDLPRLVADAGLSEAFHDSGYCDHASAIREMLGSDLLMLSYTDSRVTDVSVPGRIYEMIRTLCPIIALTPSRGALTNLLANIDGCHIVPPDDRNAAALAIDRYVSMKTVPPVRNRRQIALFERREQARRLSELCHKLMKDRKTP
jgi:glycosyltransferase involved in cell wall biosynthesis